METAFKQGDMKEHRFILTGWPLQLHRTMFKVIYFQVS